jgi:hypothetical protein
MTGIYMSMYAYSAENNDQFPPHVGVFLDTGEAWPKSFISPSHGNDASSITYTGQAPPSRYYRFGDYFWTYEGLGGNAEANAPFQAILGFGLSHDGEGRVVLFGDGHTEFVDPAAFQEKLKEDAEVRAQSGLPAIDLSALGAAGP